MKRPLVPICLLAATAAFAQDAHKPAGVSIHLGYGFSQSFDKGSGDSGRIEGPEIGVALPIGTFLRSGVLLEPSYFGGGRGRKGGDDDADVYRLTAFLHRTFARGVGGRIGVGFSSSARARSGAFDGKSGLIFDLGVEIPFAFKRIQTLQPYADLHGVISEEKLLSGVFFGVGVRL